MVKREMNRKTGLFADQWFKLKTKHQTMSEASRRNPENNGNKQAKWADRKVRGRHQEQQKREMDRHQKTASEPEEERGNQNTNNNPQQARGKKKRKDKLP